MDFIKYKNEIGPVPKSFRSLYKNFRRFSKRNSVNLEPSKFLDSQEQQEIQKSNENKEIRKKEKEKNME